MITIAKAVSSLFYATNEECDSVLPVLAFTMVGLLLVICLVVTSGTPSFDVLKSF